MDTVKNLCIRYVTAICYSGYSFVMCGKFCSFAVDDICMTLGAPQTKFCTHWLTRSLPSDNFGKLTAMNRVVSRVKISIPLVSQVSPETTHTSK